MEIWIALILIYSIRTVESALAFSVSDAARLLSVAKSKKIRVYYYTRLVLLPVFWPITSLLRSLHLVIGLYIEKKRQPDEDEDLP